MPVEVENINPSVYSKCKERVVTEEETDENIRDAFDEREIFGKSGFCTHHPEAELICCLKSKRRN